MGATTSRLESFSDNPEHVVLANCQDPNGVQSSQMAYFSGSPNDNPAVITPVQTSPGLTIWWEGGSPVLATFPDGNVFSASIVPNIHNNGDFAGFARNIFGGFQFWKFYVPGLYSRDGITCYSIYDCDHREGGTKVSTVMQSGTVVLDVIYDLPSIYSNVWKRWSEQKYDDTPVYFGSASRCSVRFSGDAAIPDWDLMHSQNMLLIDGIGNLAKIQTEAAGKQGHCLEVRGKGICVRYSHEPVSGVPHEVEVLVANTAPPSKRGNLKAIISRDAPPGPDCRWCKALNIILGAGALDDRVRKAFAGAKLVSEAACDLSGC